MTPLYKSYTLLHLFSHLIITVIYGVDLTG